MEWLIVSLIIPLLIAGWVASDARRRGFSRNAIIGWFLGVWLILIVFLPLYLILRNRRKEEKEGKGSWVCPYCGRLYTEKTPFCPYCEHKLE